MSNYRGTMFAVAFMSLSITGCGGSNSSDGGITQPSAPTTSTQPSAPTTFAEAISAADRSGAIPALNRDASVAGPDANANGVRDDIDTIIASQTATAPQKAALAQMSSAITNAMTVDVTNQNSLTDASRKIANASACLHAQFDSAAASAKVLEMEKVTVNTKARFQAYEAFSAAISGTSFVLPQGDGCAN